MDIGVVPNHTLLIQALLFLIFVAVINFVLVKPYVGAIQRREQMRDENLASARKLREEAEGYLTQAKEILEKARAESAEILESARKEAGKIRAEILGSAEEEAQREIAEKTKEIRRLLEEEKEKLEISVRDLAQALVRKITGVAA